MGSGSGVGDLDIDSELLSDRLPRREARQTGKYGPASSLILCTMRSVVIGGRLADMPTRVRISPRSPMLPNLPMSSSCPILSSWPMLPSWPMSPN